MVVGDDRLRDRDPVAPHPHEALLRRVAESDLAPLPGKGTTHEGIEPLPRAVPVEGIGQEAYSEPVSKLSSDYLNRSGAPAR